MATIVQSEILENAVQADGTRHVRERHVDSLGGVHEYCYAAPVGADVQETLAARAAWLPGWLAQKELDESIERIERGEVTGVPAWTSAQSLVSATRARYKTARGDVAANFAIWLLTRSNEELQEAFEMNQGQVTALKARLGNGSAAKAALQALEGE